MGCSCIHGMLIRCYYDYSFSGVCALREEVGGGRAQDFLLPDFSVFFFTQGVTMEWLYAIRLAYQTYRPLCCLYFQTGLRVS